MWLREELRDRSVKYRVDRDHPLIQALRRELSDTAQRSLISTLRAIEESFPGEAFYNDRANERVGFRASQGDLERAESIAYLYDLGSKLLSSFADTPEVQRRLWDSLDSIEPFTRHSDLMPEVKEKLAYEFRT
jgi:hypothetical protein